MTTTVERQTSEAAAEAAHRRLFVRCFGAFHLLCVRIGTEARPVPRPGEGAPLTAAELADRLDLDRWYVTRVAASRSYGRAGDGGRRRR